MRPMPYHLKPGWVCLLACLFCTGGYARANVAAAPPMLRDVRLIYQDQRWDVVLRGSGFIKYKATKRDAPLRLVVDLPETVSNTVSYRKILDNEIVDSIDILVIVHSPEPKTRVVIGLNQDIAYEISRSQEEIRVSFAAPTSLSKTDSAPDKQAAESVADVKSTEARQARTGATPRLLEEESGDSTKAEGTAESVANVSPTEARQARTGAIPRLPEEESGDFAMADKAAMSVSRFSLIETRKSRMAAIPHLPEEEPGYPTRNVGESHSHPASKLVEIRAVEVEEKLIISVLANGSLHNYRAFQLDNPARLVVDLLGVRSTEVNKVLNLYGPLIDKIRIGLRDDRVRVVFDLIPPKGLPYQVVAGDDRLQVSFMPGSDFPTPEEAAKPPAGSREADESVQRFIEKWRLAWEEGDLLSYLACYHPQFRDRDMGLEGWGQYKELLFERYPERVILLTDITAEWKGSAALVVSKQEYRSETHRDIGQKTLHLRWHRGHWTIYRESWQPLPDPG